MNSSIKVNIPELLDLLKSMTDEGYSTAELEIEDSLIEEDSYLHLRAIDPVTGDNPDYGNLPYDSGELM